MVDTYLIMPYRKYSCQKSGTSGTFQTDLPSKSDRALFAVIGNTIASGGEIKTEPTHPTHLGHATTFGLWVRYSVTPTVYFARGHTILLILLERADPR